MLKIDNKSGLLIVRTYIRHKKSGNLDGVQGESQGFVIRVDGLKCFNYEIKNVKIACHDLNSKLGVVGLIGMNFLNNFSIHFDFSKGKIKEISLQKILDF